MIQLPRDTASGVDRSDSNTDADMSDNAADLSTSSGDETAGWS